MRPISDTISKKKRVKPPNLSSMLDVADRMSHATNAKFTYGVAYQLNEYTADGTIFDYMAGKRKVRSKPFYLVHTTRQMCYHSAVLRPVSTEHELELLRER